MNWEDDYEKIKKSEARMRKTTKILVMVLSVIAALLIFFIAFVFIEGTNAKVEVVAAEGMNYDITKLQREVAAYEELRWEMQESAVEAITEAAEVPVELEPETETETEASSEALIEFECLTEYESETEVLRCIEFEDWEYDEFLRVVEAEVTSDSPKGLDYDTAVQCKLHVAQVIVNRVKDSRFPDTLHGVIFQSGQFMPTWDGRFWSVEISDSTREACYKAICEGTEDTTYGSLFFIADTMRMTGYYVFTDEVGHNFFALD